MGANGEKEQVTELDRIDILAMVLQGRDGAHTSEFWRSRAHRLLSHLEPVMAVLGLEQSGIWYCRRHAGTVNEDQERGLCPWWEHADHCDAEHDEGLDDGACSPCQWVELVIPPALTGSTQREGA